MADRVFHQIYLHLVWHAKDDQPVLIPRIEKLVHEAIRDRCSRMHGVTFHGVGGTETHVHVGIDITPAVLISDAVSKLKGGTSFDINSLVGEKTLEWQRGYGVVSFSKRDLAWIIHYIADQKAHHDQETTADTLEHIHNEFDA